MTKGYVVVEMHERKELDADYGLRQALAVSDLESILKSVSRSFYLSMRLLPDRMCSSVSLAYLLARASDTLADTEGLDPRVKLEALHAFMEKDLIRVEKLVRAQYLAELDHVGERKLLEQLAQIVKEVERLDTVEQEQINWVTEVIAQGQCMDIQRFEVDKKEMESEGELLDYCYSVAGCVGEFWTRMGFHHDPSFSLLDKDELEVLGRDFGIGLQLVNILRDAPKDLEGGRVYIPGMRTLEKEGIDPWLEKAHAAMVQGVSYSDSLRHRFSRIAVYLPAVLGEDTLTLIERASLSQWRAGVKVARVDVFRELFSGLLRSQKKKI